MKRAAAIVAGVLVVVAAVVVRFGSRGRRPVVSTLAVAEFQSAEARILELVNSARKQAGVPPLILSDRLLSAARMHSQDMAAHRYLAHESADGIPTADRVRAAGLDYEEVAENLFSDPRPDIEALPTRAMTAWLASPEPRVNLLAARVRTAAVAIARAVDGSFYVTLDLMR
ncbi:MAG: CAP domain-containing protein [Deltaproteobacteria bacterium]|nr:CAP domain-containing protein [Deltaproteobacteria bacterium]